MSAIAKIKSFLFQNSSIKQTIAKNTVWLMSGEIISRFFRAFFVIYSVRVLGAEEWGIFSYAMALATFFVLFSDIGLSSILTRETAKNPEMQNQYISTAFILKAGLLTLSVILIIFIAPFFTKIESAIYLLPFVAVILAFDGLREFGMAINRSTEKMEREAFIKIFTGILAAISGIIFLRISATGHSLAIAYIISSFVGFFSTFLMLKSYFKNIFSNFSKDLLWKILSSAWPYAILGMFGSIIINTDIIIIGWLKSARDVGLYSAVQKPIQILYVLPALFSSAILPVMARLAEKDSLKFGQILEKSIVFILLVGMPLAIETIFFSENIIELLFGKEYLAATTSLQILALTIIIVFPATIIGNAVLAYDMQRKMLPILIVCATGNIALNYILIAPFGIAGAAAATVFSQLAANWLIFLKMNKVANIKIVPYLKNILIASGGIMLIISTSEYVKIHYMIGAVLSGIGYLGILAILKDPFLYELLKALPRKQTANI